MRTYIHIKRQLQTLAVSLVAQMLKRSRKQVSLLAICGVVVLFWLVSWFSTDGRSASLTSTRGRLSSHARHTLVNRTCEPIRDVEGNTNRQHYVEFDGVVYPRHVSLYQNRSINFECLNANPSGVKKILFWNSFCDSASFSYGLGVSQPFVDNNCPATNCETFTDRSRIAESDLILVHMRDHIDPLPSPSRQRLANERWVFVLYESPVHADDYRIYDGRFDLASTYSLESDFPDFYSAGANLNWELNDNFDLESIERQLAAKPNFAALVVSNCNDRSRRLDYVDELAKHVPVDVFGKCGRECPTHLRDGRPADCKEIIGHEYKFYLAFENSVCDEYITEKFFAILSKPIIPVVLGGGFYDYYVSRTTNRQRFPTVNMNRFN